ncbi:YybH family protein [Chryseolinea lacunae]|uniref:DUF4440 domain-containing protein n=1 Tax=Chryseolinea lacunae TaxID=2801331 RepID=A0ABS1L105_9BACT|nr:DUF4440 domain-containing protein [Chryseolinea lacunae]MBL0745138.1 DUF4440 domain-containing protein [Chryseolinea lacunae]
MKTTFFLAAALGVLSQCATKEFSGEDLKRIAKKNNDALGRFFMTGNADSLALMYGEQATLCPNGDDFVKGRDNIRKFWADDMKTTKTLAMETETITVSGTREVIYETGRTHLNIQYGDTTFQTTVKYCNVWREQPDGTYRLEVDIWNRDKSK